MASIKPCRSCSTPRTAILVDGVWCAVRSSNFDGRSFETNDEITLGFNDRALAKRLEEIFEDDRRHCTELNAGDWKKRGLLHRARTARSIFSTRSCRRPSAGSEVLGGAALRAVRIEIGVELRLRQNRQGGSHKRK